jgi:hypothetical protein
MKTISINIYSFNELTEAAKENAINQHADFMDLVGFDYEDENGNMQMDYSRPNDAEVIENIEANEYLFFLDGELASITQYAGNHPMAGTSEFKLHSQIYRFKSE